MTDLIAHAQLLARYNRLANQALLDVCQTLPETILLKAQGASFDSVLGTLNHMLIGDCIWLNRFEGSLAASTGLGKMPYPTLALFQSSNSSPWTDSCAFASSGCAILVIGYAPHLKSLIVS